MNKTIIKAPSIMMNKLEDLFIEMTSQNCNLHCKHCFKEFKDKKVKDFISIEKVKQAFTMIDKNELQYIHLTGAEPMLHKEFNHILRLCLKYSSVIIHTNALNINDKKARFLRKVEEENSLGNEIVFIISIDHYDEKINDELRGRGAFRKAFHAIQSLIKYDFNPIISIVNYWKLDENELKLNFKQLFSTINFETTDINFKILPYIEKDKFCQMPDDISKVKTECSRGRTLTINGIFTCPLLANDNRGMCGSDFSDYTKRNYLETCFCSQCVNSSKPLFCIDTYEM